MKSERRMNRAAAVLLCLLLASCNGIPIPPIPTPAPPTEYNCANPPALSGVISVKDPIEGRYIVVFKQALALVDDDRARGIFAVETTDQIQAFASRYAVRVLSASSVGTLRLATVVTTAQVAAQVAGDPRVAYVQQEGRKKTNVVPGLDRIDQRDLPLDQKFEPGGDGDGVAVFIVDTGVTDVPDFGGRLSTDCFTAHTFGGCADRHGHGTHVAGTVGGSKYGVAKRVKIIPVRVLDDQGSGTDSDVIAGHDWMVGYKKDHPGRYVVNESLGGSPAPALDASVCAAIQAGITFAVAAGNDGADARDSSPARVLQALTVGAMDPRNDKAADFSNRGPVVDVWGPGVAIESDRPDGGTATHDGTSMACPHAAGVAALCAARHLGADPTEVMRCVIASATPDKISGGGETANRLLYARE